MWTCKHLLDLEFRNYIISKEKIYTVFKLKFPIQFSKSFSAYNEATVTCNTAMERRFCGLSGDVSKNCEKLSYEAKLAFFRRMAELAKNLIY